MHENSGASVGMRQSFVQRAGAHFVGRALKSAVGVAALMALLVFDASFLVAQNTMVGRLQRATRTDLAARAQQLEQQISSGSAKGKALDESKTELAEIKSRLDNGDFQVGDRFMISVRMDSVRADTASVRDSLKVTVLGLPDMSLQGVLRSELDERLNAHIARYIRNVNARTTVLTRVAILGAVRMPGFYYAPPDRPVSDLVMIAGGPAPDANLDQFEVYRAHTRMLSAKDSRAAIRSGLTLEQLDIRSGDEFRVPQKRRFNWQLIIQTMFLVSSLTFAAINFLRWYYDRQN